jgi:1-acylglycerone phosphate reductase
MKSVLITGCSNGGIGSALAITFAQRGLLVFATTRNVFSMSKLGNLPNVRCFALDITEHTNNAALGRFMPILDEAEGFEKTKELFDVNLWAQMNMVQAFAPLLIEAKATLVHNSSAAAHVNAPWILYVNNPPDQVCK